MDNPFSWDYLTAPLSETPTFGPFSIFYLVLFGLVFLAGAFLYYEANRRFATHKLNRELVHTVTQWMMWIAGIALFFFVFRFMRFEFLTFERRIWMYLMFVIFIGVLGYFVYYYRTVYPPKLAAFERNRARRAYLPQQGGRRKSKARASRAAR